MRLLAFVKDHQPRIGALTDAGVIDLSLVDAAAPTDLGAVIKAGQFADIADILAAADGTVHYQLDELDLQVPITTPGKILCLGLNYMDHIAEGPFEKQPFPAIFMRSPTSLVAAHKPILAPRMSNTMDYEAELAVIIGQKCKHLTADNALDVIAGYSCFNDGSVREYQRHTIQWTMGKNFDQTGPFGPVLVTPDELPPAADGLKIECRLNGQTVQSSTTDMMIFKVVETLVYITEAMTLDAGDIVVMGTPSGVGHGRKPPLWMQDGDVVEVEIEKIGLLCNPVKAI
ncbi:MAG: fumarylacetoacetate hydrolase family protein [Proteobacteria bacterium]|nr:fumarylacetoacetate hydrolase family protein [Pseudomonadota bacterium]MDA0844728.1 fumarylacetoacetate hydrolase family protein [Pseudomonadota bacterium]